jgi:hypothetical protein
LFISNTLIRKISSALEGGDEEYSDSDDYDSCDYDDSDNGDSDEYEDYDEDNYDEDRRDVHRDNIARGGGLRGNIAHTSVISNENSTESELFTHMNIDVNNTDIRITDNTDIRVADNTANDEAELSAGLGYSLLSLNLPVLFWALVLNRYIYGHL